MDLFDSDGKEASLEDAIEWLCLKIPENAPEPLLTVRNASESFIHTMAESQDIENVERPTDFMEKVKKAHRSLQLWGERETLQLVEYTESLEDGIEALELIIKSHHKDNY